MLITSENYTFTYNAQGQRTQKKYTYLPGAVHEIDCLTSSTSVYEYDLHGRLLSDTRTLKYYDGTIITKKFVFIYEESEIVGVIFTNSSGTGTYYYDKNPRGDVVNILDNSGNIVVKYTYDAYGNCTRGYTTNNDLADSNPIRYRSYYYDADTGLYYLNARYYNPQWRRFISPDNITYLDIENANGLNLYAYCLNDPINYKDPSGHLAITTIAIITGAIIGFGISATSSIVTQLEEYNGDWSKVNQLEVLYDGAFGAINGGLAASGIGIVASAIFGGALGFVSSIGRDFLFEEDRNINWLGAVNSLFIGALAGLIAGAGANYAKDGMQVVKFGNSRDILSRTIANGSQRAIARQTHALNVHATQLLISGIRYMLSNTFSISYTMLTN